MSSVGYNTINSHHMAAPGASSSPVPNSITLFSANQTNHGAFGAAGSQAHSSGHDLDELLLADHLTASKPTRVNLTTPALPHPSPVNTVFQNPNTDNTRAPHTPSGPSQVSNKQGLERYPTEATARVEQTPNGTARKPPSQWNKVKKYCIRCEERRLNGGYKLHHCTECEYHVAGEPETGAQGAAPRLRNSTPIRTEKIYCSRCIERKNTRRASGRPQRAKYNCAACVTLRSDAKSRETSKFQGPSQRQSQSEPQSDLLPGPQSNFQPGPQSNPQVGPQSTPQLGLQSSSQSNPQSGPQLNPGPGHQSNLQPGPQSNPQAGPQSNLLTGSQSDLQPGPQPSPQSNFQPGPQANPQSSPQPGPQSNLQPGPQSSPQPGPQSDLQPDPQPAEAAPKKVTKESKGWQWPTGEPSPWPTTTIRWSEVRLSPDQSALPPSPLGPAFQPWGRNVVLYRGIGRDVLSARPIEDLLTNQDGWCSWM